MTTRMYGPADDRHGTVNGYTNLSCRCDRCRAAMREKGKLRSATPTPCPDCGQTFRRDTISRHRPREHPVEAS